MWQECKITLQHTRPCYAKSSYRSVDPQTLYGNVHQAYHVPNGPTNSVVTTMFPLRLCGGKPSVAVTRERRYGPSRLRVNDDDDDAPCYPAARSKNARCLSVHTAVYHASSGEADRPIANNAQDNRLTAEILGQERCSETKICLIFLIIAGQKTLTRLDEQPASVDTTGFNVWLVID